MSVNIWIDLNYTLFDINVFKYITFWQGCIQRGSDDKQKQVESIKSNHPLIHPDPDLVDGSASSRRAFWESSLFWRRENILAGPPGPTARAATASCPLDLWEWWERDTLLKDLLCHDPLSLVLRSITGQRRTQTTSVRELQLCREEDGNRGWWHSQLVGSRLPGPCGQCQSCQRDVSLRWLSCCCYQTPLTHEPGLDHCFSP